MKKIYFLFVFFGALLFCACEKVDTDNDRLIEEQKHSQIEEETLKGVKSSGMTIEDATPFPMAARMGGGAEFVIPATKDYGIITFYVDPSIIPEDHNFYPMGWFVLEALFVPQEEYLVEGKAWFLPEYPDVPHHYYVKGKGKVLFWIITFDQVMELYESGEVTIPKILACDPMVGYACKYFEFLKPFGGGAKVFGGIFSAIGTLEDGRWFIYRARTRAFPGEPMEGEYMFKIF